MSESGPNLGVRGVGSMLVLAGLLLMAIGYRMRTGTSRLRVPPAMTSYGFGAFAVAGVAAVCLGAFLLGVGS